MLSRLHVEGEGAEDFAHDLDLDRDEEALADDNSSELSNDDKTENSQGQLHHLGHLVRNAIMIESDELVDGNLQKALTMLNEIIVSIGAQTIPVKGVSKGTS